MRTRAATGAALALAALAAGACAAGQASATTAATKASGRTFYVATTGSDANPGTKTRPFATIWHASGVTRPGDTVLVRGGTYYLAGTQYIASHGTAKAPITYRSAPGERAVLDGSRTADGNLVDVRGRYNVVQGFEIRNAKNFCLITLGAMYSTIAKNVIHGCTQSAIGIEGGIVGGDKNPWTVGMRVVGNEVYDAVRAHAANPKAGSAPSVHADYAQNVTFAGNHIHDNHQIGIELAIVKGATVQGNRLHGNDLQLHLDNATGVTVADNFMYHRPGGPTDTGIQTANIDWPYSNPLRDITVRNNVIVGGNYGFMYGTYGRGGGLRDVVVEHNTFYGATGWVLLIAADRGHRGSRFTDNVFVKGGAAHDVDVPTNGITYARNCWSGGPAGRAAGKGDVKATPRFVAPGGISAAGYAQRTGSPCAAMGARPGTSTATARTSGATPAARPAASPAPPKVAASRAAATSVVARASSGSTSASTSGAAPASAAAALPVAAPVAQRLPLGASRGTWVTALGAVSLLAALALGSWWFRGSAIRRHGS